MKVLKKYLLDILAVVLIAIVSFVNFMPADMDGRNMILSLKNI